MVVAEGAGTCSKFTCPYHHWSYSLDGRLLRAPAMQRADGFDKSQNGPPSLPVDVWNGFVFTSLAAAPPPLAPGLAQVGQLLRNRSEVHRAELQSQMRRSYDVLGLKQKKN